MKHLFIFLLFVSHVCFASGGGEEISLNFEIQSTLYQSNLQAQLYVTKELNQIMNESLVNQSYEPDEDLDELFEAISNGGCCTKDKGILPFIKNTVKHSIHEVRELTRREGLAVAIIAGAGEVVEWLSPVVLTAIGQPQLLLFVPIVSSAEFNVPVSMAISKLINRKKLLRAYGGKENLETIRNLRKEVRSKFGLSEGAMMFSEDDHYFTVSKKLSLFQKLGSHLKPSKSINPITLKKVLKRNNLWNPELQKIKKADIALYLKSILIIDYVLKNFPQGHAVLTEYFPSTHFDIKNSKKSGPIVDWAKEFDHVKTMKDLSSWSAKIPKGTKALDVMLLWKQVFYPRLIEDSDGMGFKNYRRWSKEMNVLFAKAELSPYQSWDNSWQENFDKYLLGQ